MKGDRYGRLSFLLKWNFCYTFVEMLYIMEATLNITKEKKIQTAFRFKRSLIERLRTAARAENTSVNEYVERVLAEKLDMSLEEKYEYVRQECRKMKLHDIDVPENLKRLRGCISFTQEEIKADDKLEYILGK